MMYIGEIDEYFDYHIDSFNNLKRVSSWAKVFGKKNITTFLYDKAHFNSNVLKSFLNIIDPNINIEPSKNKLVHHALDSKFIKILKDLDKLEIRFETRDKIARLLKEISKGDNKDILSLELMNKITATYKDSNKVFLDDFVHDENQYNIFKRYNLS